MKPKITQSQFSFKRKYNNSSTPIGQMNKSQVSATSQISQSRSYKSLSQGHSNILLKSGHQTLLQKMANLPEDIVSLKQQNAQLRIMQLSQNARQSLMKLQRFDRFIYPLESDRILKKPIQQELRRLEKIKNQQNLMRGKLYDNQLTITALYNHIKLIFQMNRELQEREVLRKQKDQAVRMLHQQKRDSLKQVRELKQQMRQGNSNITPSKISKNSSQQLKQQKTKTTFIQKQQITTINLISANLKGKKYAEALEQIKHFINKQNVNQPQACKIFQIFLPTLQNLLSTLAQVKTFETKITQINIIIDRINKQIRTNHFDELQKIKNEALKNNQFHKNIGLLLQTIINSKILYNDDKKKRIMGDEGRSLQKVNQRVKLVQDDLKIAKEQLIKQKTINTQNLKAKQLLAQQLQKIQADFNKVKSQLQHHKKFQAEQKKINGSSQTEPLKKISTITKKFQNQMKATKDQLNIIKSEKETVERQNQTLQNQINQLKEQVKSLKKLNFQLKIQIDQISNSNKALPTSTKNKIRSKQNIDQIELLKQQLNNQKLWKNNLQEEMQRLQNQNQELKNLSSKPKEYQQKMQRKQDQIQKLKQQLFNIKNLYKKLEGDLNNYKKIQGDLKRSTTKLKSTQDQLRKIKQDFSNQKQKNLDNSRVKKNLESQLQKYKTQNQKLKKIQLQYQQLRSKQAQFKRINQKLRMNLEQIRQLRQDLDTERSKNYEITHQNQNLVKQIQKLKIGIQTYRTYQKQIKMQEVQSIKKIQNEAKIKQQKLIQNLRKQIKTAQTDLQNMINYIDKIIKAAQSTKSIQNLQKLRKQLSSTTQSSARKTLPLLQIIIRKNNQTNQFQTNIGKFTKQQNEKRKKLQGQIKQINNQLSGLKENSNIISHWLKSTARIWARTKSQQLLKGNKIIDILLAELKKNNKSSTLQHLSSQIIALTQNIKNIMMNQITKVEDNYLRLLDQKKNQMYKIVLKQQTLLRNQSEKDIKIGQLQDIIKNLNNTANQLDRENHAYIKQIQKMIKEQERLKDQADSTAQQLLKYIQNNAKLNKQLILLKKQTSKIANERQILEVKLQQASQEIQRIKKYTQDFVKQQRKVLETLEYEGKQKQKYQRQLQYLQKTIQKIDKQKQYYEKKTKNQDVQLLKYKQMEIDLQNMLQQTEIKCSNLNSIILIKQKQIKNLQERNKIILQQKQKIEQDFLTIESQLHKNKIEIQKNNRMIKDNLQKSERQKYENVRQIQKLNTQIRFQIQQKQSQKKHFGIIITRLQNNLSDAELHRSQQIKQIQDRMQIVVKQKEQSRMTLQIQLNKCRQLRQINKDLQNKNNNDQRQKSQMRRQIGRLSQQLKNIKQNYEIQKNQLQKVIEKHSQQRHKINQQRIEQKHVLQQQIQKTRNQQYQINYQKLKKHREQIRILQDQIDKLNELIDINQANYNKLVQDNRLMYDKIMQMQQNKKNYLQEVKILKDKSYPNFNNIELQDSTNMELTKHIQKLEAQVKQFQLIIATNNKQLTNIDCQNDRIKQLQTKIQQLRHENIKLKVQQDETIKNVQKYKQQNMILKSQNSALQKQLYSIKLKPDSTQNQLLFLSKYQDMARKYQQINQQHTKNRIQSTNLQRLLKQRQLQTLRVLQVKHLQMQKQMLDNNWKQRMQIVNQRNQQLIKQVQYLKNNYQNKKEQYKADYLNLRLEKDKLQRALDDRERKFNQIKEEVIKINRQLVIRAQDKKIYQQKYNQSIKNLQQKSKQCQKLDKQNKQIAQTNIQLNQKLVWVEQSHKIEIQRINNLVKDNIQGLQKQIEAKNKIIQQKQIQSRQFIDKFTHQNHGKTTLQTEKQIQYQTNNFIFQRNIQDLKRQNQMLQLHLQIVTKKLQQKLGESSNLLMQLKQSQSDKQLSHQQSKYKIQTLTNKVNDLLNQSQSMKTQIRNCNMRFQKENKKNKQQIRKLEISLNETNNLASILQSSFKKIKIQNYAISKRERMIRDQYESQQNLLSIAQAKQTHIESSHNKIKKQNNYLKQIAQLLDSNYVENSTDDQNQIKILMKISEQISYLIQKNIQLETKLKSYNFSQHNDQQWLSTIEFLIQSILDYLHEGELLQHANVTKFVYSAQFKAQRLHEHKQKYIVYVQNFIKQLFQSVFAELSQNINLYERTFSDMRKLVQSYFISGDHKFLQSLRKCLKNFDE